MTTRLVGEIYSSKHTQYSEATQYCYYNGVHDLALFWTKPTPTEINGFLSQPVEISHYVEGSILFLLYRIVDICEWSDVAYNIHQLRDEARELPADIPGNRDQLQMTLVNAGNGIILAKRKLSLSPAMTQALRHTLQAQMKTPLSRFEYESQVQQIYARYPDSDAMLKNAGAIETASPDASTH